MQGPIFQSNMEEEIGGKKRLSICSDASWSFGMINGKRGLESTKSTDVSQIEQGEEEYKADATCTLVV